MSTSDPQTQRVNTEEQQQRERDASVAASESSTAPTAGSNGQRLGKSKPPRKDKLRRVETLLKDIEDGDRTKLLLNAADACDRCNTLWACIVSVPNDEIVKPDADEDGEDNAQQASKPSARRKLSCLTCGTQTCSFVGGGSFRGLSLLEEAQSDLERLLTSMEEAEAAESDKSDKVERVRGVMAKLKAFRENISNNDM